MDVKEVWGKAWSLRPGQNTTNMKCVGTIIKSGMQSWRIYVLPMMEKNMETPEKR